ncbi:hypothetical protein [uncultured Eudoraea sp.]|uniref:hypothetical protein n=1 Tax=uncultured Eudoraea sp. TaxID=1035614 RepID=UPI0026273F1B|nr:hypothetical protein [uncultured Eudoraea sp.]
MEENNDKQLDDFVKKIVKSTGLETPSVGFTQNIMSKIVAQEAKSTVTVYQPLISKTSWLILATIILLLLAYVIFGKLDLTISWLPNINSEVLNKIGFMDALSQINLPDTAVYSLIGIMLFFYVQIIFMKRHLESRFTLN